MTKRKIQIPEALQLLANGQLDHTYLVEFSASDRVEATDAIKLGAAGADVPEACIYYDDTNIAEDEAFDGERVQLKKLLFNPLAHHRSRLRS